MRHKTRNTIFVLALLAGSVDADAGKSSPADRSAAKMPAHWRVMFDFVVPSAQVTSISAKLGGQLATLRNTGYEVSGKRVQLNKMVAASTKDADTIMRTLRQMKADIALLRQGVVIYEFVGKNDVLPQIKAGKAHLKKTHLKRARLKKAQPEKVSSPPSKKAAVAEARRWLKIVDSGKYDTAWAEAGSLIKGAVSKKQFAQALGAARRPIGKLFKRSLRDASFKTELPGVPDGEYVVIQFETRFENKRSTTETITPMREKDGQWRIAGYYIK